MSGLDRHGALESQVVNERRSTAVLNEFSQSDCNDGGCQRLAEAGKNDRLQQFEPRFLPSRAGSLPMSGCSVVTPSFSRELDAYTRVDPGAYDNGQSRRVSQPLSTEAQAASGSNLASTSQGVMQPALGSSRLPRALGPPVTSGFLRHFGIEPLPTGVVAPAASAASDSLVSAQVVPLCQEDYRTSLPLGKASPNAHGFEVPDMAPLKASTVRGSGPSAPVSEPAGPSTPAADTTFQVRWPGERMQSLQGRNVPHVRLTDGSRLMQLSTSRPDGTPATSFNMSLLHDQISSAAGLPNTGNLKPAGNWREQICPSEHEDSWKPVPLQDDSWRPAPSSAPPASSLRKDRLVRKSAEEPDMRDRNVRLKRDEAVSASHPEADLRRADPELDDAHNADPPCQSDPLPVGTPTAADNWDARDGGAQHNESPTSVAPLLLLQGVPGYAGTGGGPSQGRSGPSGMATPDASRWDDPRARWMENCYQRHAASLDRHKQCYPHPSPCVSISGDTTVYREQLKDIYGPAESSMQSEGASQSFQRYGLPHQYMSKLPAAPPRTASAAVSSGQSMQRAATVSFMHPADYTNFAPYPADADPRYSYLPYMLPGGGMYWYAVPSWTGLTAGSSPSIPAGPIAPIAPMTAPLSMHTPTPAGFPYTFPTFPPATPAPSYGYPGVPPYVTPAAPAAPFMAPSALGALPTSHMAFYQPVVPPVVPPQFPGALPGMAATSPLTIPMTAALLAPPTQAPPPVAMAHSHPSVSFSSVAQGHNMRAPSSGSRR
eukprot:jgi/Chlat1/3416/Chrsp23S03747